MFSHIKKINFHRILSEYATEHHNKTGRVGIVLKVALGKVLLNYYTMQLVEEA